MTPANTAKLDLKIQTTNIKIQKINDSTFEMLKMFLTNFQVKDKLSKAYFFQKKFLLVTTSINVTLKMFFLIFSNTHIVFANQKLT